MIKIPKSQQAEFSGMLKRQMLKSHSQNEAQALNPFSQNTRLSLFWISTYNLATHSHALGLFWVLKMFKKSRSLKQAFSGFPNKSQYCIFNYIMGSLNVSVQIKPLIKFHITNIYEKNNNLIIMKLFMILINNKF